MRILLPLMLVLVALPMWGDENQAAELERLRAENAELKARVVQLEAQLTELTRSSPASADMDSTESQRVAELEQKVQTLEQLAGVTATGEKVESKRALIKTEYYKKANETVVRTQPERMSITHGSRHDHWLSFAYAYPGEQLDGEPEKVTLFIQTQLTGGDYDAKTQLTFTLDAADKLTLTPASYDRVHKRSRTGGTTTARKDNETLVYTFTWPQFQQLARAYEVEGTLGKVRFKLTGDQLADLKALRERVRLGV